MKSTVSLNITIAFQIFLVLNFTALQTVLAQQGACVRIEWSENYGGFLNDAANKVIQTIDGGYLAVGYSRSTNMMVTQNKGKSDFWIAKVDSLGSLQWQSSFGGSENDIASDAVQTPDGGFLVVGGTSSFEGDIVGSHGEEDVWLLKLSPTGNLIWSKTFGGSLNERIESIEPTADGNYIMAGYSDSNNGDISTNKGDFDYWLVKINGSGTLLWEKSFGGSLADWGFDVKQMPDGGYMMAGSTISGNGDVADNNGFYDYWIIRTDANGDLIWQKNYGGTLEERAYSLALTPDGGAIIAGTSNSSDWDVQANFGSYDYWLIRIASDGALIWSKNFGGNSEDRSFSVSKLRDGHYLVAGFSVSNTGQVISNYGSYDGWVIKFDIDGAKIWDKNLGGTKEDRLYSIIEQANGGFTATGLTTSDDLDLPDNFGQKDLWIISLSPDSLSIDLGNDTTLCFNDNIVLELEIDSVTFLWSDGSTEAFLPVTSAGEYWLEVDMEGCKARDSLIVEYLSDTPVQLGNDTILCEGETLLLTLDFPGANYTWRDGSNNDTFLVKIPGIYWVNVQKDGCEQKDSIDVDFTTIEIDFPETAFICQGDELELDVERPQGTYLWQNGSTDPVQTVNGPGVFWVNVTQGGCSGSDTILVDFQPGPDSIFADTAYLCKGEGIWFDASFQGASYLWQDGSVDPRFKAVEPGIYSVDISINGCVFEHEIDLESCEKCLFIPNIFSPNGDGINDVFRTFPICDLTNYHQLVFDRWGNAVFESFSTEDHWDGTFKGSKATPDSYVYLIRYEINNDGKPLSQQRTGTLSLIR